METPAISSSTYASNVVDWNQVMGVAAVAQPLNLNRLAPLFDARQNLHNVVSQTMEGLMTRRLVQVFIADSNDNLPLEMGLLYKGEQKFTDATDQELFFEIDINSILKAHNEKRVKVIDKKVKERTEYLEPAKIRDLKMVVVEVAKF